MCSTSRMLHVYLLGTIDRALAMLSGKVAPRAALPNDCRKERLSTAIDWLKPRGPLRATSHTIALLLYRPSRFSHLGCCKSRTEGAQISMVAGQSAHSPSAKRRIMAGRDPAVPRLSAPALVREQLHDRRRRCRSRECQSRERGWSTAAERPSRGR